MFGDDPSALREATATSDYFNKVWAQRFPHLRIKARGDFMLCDTCTRLKGLLHGEPGQRAVQDGDAARRYKLEYDAHVKVGAHISRRLVFPPVRPPE